MCSLSCGFSWEHFLTNWLALWGFFNSPLISQLAGGALSGLVLFLGIFIEDRLKLKKEFQNLLYELEIVLRNNAVTLIDSTEENDQYNNATDQLRVYVSRLGAFSQRFERKSFFPFLSLNSIVNNLSEARKNLFSLSNISPTIFNTCKRVFILELICIDLKMQRRMKEKTREEVQLMLSEEE